MGKEPGASAHDELQARETSRLAVEAEALADIGRVVTSSLGLDAVYEAFADQVRLLIPFDRIAIVIRHDQLTDDFTEVYGSGFDIPGRPWGTHPLGGTMTEHVIETRSGLVVQSDDLSKLRRQLPAQPRAIQLGFRSFLAVPLISRDEAFGALHLRSMQVNAYTDRHLALARRIGEGIAVAIANSQPFAREARLRDELLGGEKAQRQLANEAKVLAEIGRTISSSPHIDGVYEQFAELVRTLVPLDWIGISTADIAHETVTIRYILGTATSDRVSGDTVPWADTLTADVVRSKASVLFQPADVEEYSARYPGGSVRSFEEAGLKSYLSVPLIAHDEVIGVLQLRSEKFDAYTQRHVALAERVADQIAGAIASAQLYEELRHAEEEAQQFAAEEALLADIGRTITSSLDIHAVYETFADQVRPLIPFDRITIVVRDDQQSGDLTEAYISGIQFPSHQPQTPYPPGGTLTERVMESRVGVVVRSDDLSELRKRLPNHSLAIQLGIRSFLTVPLVSRDEAFGALHFRSTQMNAYTDRDLALAERVGQQIAGAISNAELHAENQRSESEARRRAEEESVLAEIGRTISSSPDIDAVYERFAALVRNLVSFDRIVISTVDVARETATIQYILGTGASGLQRGDTVPLADTVTAEVVRSRSSILFLPAAIGELATRYPGSSERLFEETSISSYLSTPLIAHDEIIGVLQLRSEKANAYGQRDVALAKSVADQIAGAIANALLYDELQRAEEEAQQLASEEAVLADIGRIITSSLDIDEVYDCFADQVRLLIPFDQIAVVVSDEQHDGHLIVYASANDAPGPLPQTVFIPEETMTDRVRETRSGLIVQSDDLSELRTRLPGLSPAIQLGFRSFIAVPLVSRDEVFGVLHFRSTQMSAYTDRDLALAERVGQQIAGAIANAELHAENQRSENEARRRAEEESALAEIGRIMSSSEEIDEVYERFAEQVNNLITSERVAITLLNPGQNTFTIAWVKGSISVPGRQPEDSSPLAGSFIEHIIRNRAALIVEAKDESELADRFPTLIPQFRAGIRSFLATPLISQGEAFGTLGLLSTEPGAYSERDVVLAERVADQIAGAIANALLRSEHRQMEEALRDSEERYRALVEHSPEGIFLVVGGKILYANEGGAETLGAATADELIGKGLADFVAPEYRGVVDERTRQLSSQGASTPPIETRITGLDGRTRDVETASVSIPYRGEVAMLIMSRDITDRKRLQEQLLRAQKMESIGTLAGGVAHDFNNMLTAIMSFTDLTLRKLSPEHAGNDFLREVLRAAERAANLTRQLLLFSRPQMAEQRVLSLNDVIVDMNNMLRRIVSESIELVVVLSPDLRSVRVDRGQMEQVLANLVINAVDAMVGGGKLTVTTENVTLPVRTESGDRDAASIHPDAMAGEYVMLTVSDSGDGMTEEVKARIFDPFFTTKDVGQGTGLGLSTCYGIVTQSQGHITVDSTPGQGSTFRVCLPHVEGEARPVPVHSDVDQLPTGNETLLLVEDEPSVRGVSAQTLRLQGYTILEASNGVDALNVAGEYSGDRIHLLLTDMVMPLMGGALLGEKFKTLYPEASILYTSGYTDDTLVGPGLHERLGEFLPKPFSPGDLARKVREVLDG